jgi:predicted 3-demethylubiquinone-9 3-methyltransferase (glyoxalase superfamily)
MSSIRAESRITPFLWFNANADDAVTFYLSVFPNARRLDRDGEPREGQAARRPATTIPFELEGQRFIALNGGPAFRFNEAVSFVIACRGQQEVDAYWNALLAGGGQEGRCGWLKDRFGLSWQVVPENMGQLLARPGAVQAMMGMQKIDIAALERAGETSGQA